MLQPKLKSILSELRTVVEVLDEKEGGEVITDILMAPQVFTAGVGRSGYIVKAFTIRIMHLGISAHNIGSPSTPSANKGDLLIIGSGSGETESLISYAKKAKKIGLKICVITSFADSSLGKMADVILQIPSPTPKSEKTSYITSEQPMGNLFEQSLFICLDALIMELMEVKSMDASSMFKNHANLE